MQESSIFGNRAPGDCRKQVRGTSIIYDGTSTTVPTLEHGVIIFGGGKTTDIGRGIGVNGPADATQPFKLDYHSILNGGSGTRILNSLDPLKRKVRLTCKNLLCGQKGERLSLQLGAIESCEFPLTVWNRWLEPIDVNFECNCLETCCQRLARVAKLINERPDYPVVATTINIGDVYYLDIESKFAGLDFRVYGKEGFAEPKDIVPFSKQYNTGYEISAWFNQSVPLANANPTKKFTVVEIFYDAKVPTTNALGTATSNEQGDIYTFHYMPEIMRVVFDEATTQSNTAFTALKTILTGSSAYNRKLGLTTAVYNNVYRYMIVRTDAGDAAALTTTRGNYTGGYVQLDRSAYQGGKSYYTFLSTTSTAPTANGSDVVTLGGFVIDDLPAITDGCPVPENSICLSCG